MVFLRMAMPKLLLSIAVFAIFPSPSCSTQTDNCTRQNDCLNGGTCGNDTGSVSCACVPGFIGNHCEINIDDCAGHVRCLNGGTCVDGANSFTCECVEAFIGSYCEHQNECVYPGTCASVGKSAKCKCRKGYAQDPHDSRRCEPVDKNLNENATLIFGMRGSSESIVQFSLSERTVTRIQNSSHVGAALDVMYRTNTMFWSDESGNIHTAPIYEGAPKKVVLTSLRSGITHIFVDWIYNHLYFANGHESAINVANLDGSMQKYLFSTGSRFTRNMVVDPLSGWIYWSDSDAYHIERAALDGSQREVIANTNPGHPTGLALDMTQNRLYYATFQVGSPSFIHSMNVDGSDIKLVFKATSVGDLFIFITTVGNFVYWTDYLLNIVYTTNKCGGGKATAIYSTVVGREGHFTTQAVHFSKQPEGVNHCKNRIGGQCSHLCFKMPSTGNQTVVTKCACPDGRTLSSDQRTCT